MNWFSSAISGGTFVLGASAMPAFEMNPVSILATFCGLVFLSILAGCGAIALQRDIEKIKHRWIGKYSKYGKDG